MKSLFIDPKNNDPYFKNILNFNKILKNLELVK